MPVPHSSRREFLLQSAGGIGAITTAQSAVGAAGDGAAQAAPPPTSIAAPESDAPVPVVAPVPGETFVHAGPLVGHVGDTAARLWVKASNACTVSFLIGEHPSLVEGRIIDGPKVAEAESFTGQVEVRELRPATRYHYCPLLDGRPALTRPYPSFVTAPVAGTRGRLRVAFGACVGRRAVHAAAAFGEMAARRNFDLLLMLGDNHYGDTTDPAKLRDYYHMMRTVDGFTRLIREVPTYAVWDDHDYGPNNSDGTQPGKEDSLRVFGQWWANPSAGEPGNPGCYFRFQRGDVEFFMLDVRYYRTPNDVPDGPTKTMLGARQLAWLLDGLAGSSAPFKIIAGGSEWQTLTQPDCWSSFARERQQIFDSITRRGIEGVVLLSGDRHRRLPGAGQAPRVHQRPDRQRQHHAQAQPRAVHRSRRGQTLDRARTRHGRRAAPSDLRNLAGRRRTARTPGTDLRTGLRQGDDPAVAISLAAVQDRSEAGPLKGLGPPPCSSRGSTPASRTVGGAERVGSLGQR